MLFLHLSFHQQGGESKLSVVSAETGEENAITIKDVSGSALKFNWNEFYI